LSDQVKASILKAAECERAAVLVTDDGMRKVYQDLALQWLEMARQAEFFKNRRLPHLGRRGRGARLRRVTNMAPLCVMMLRRAR
jgi:hypothetical protein